MADMLTENQVERLARLVRLAEYMTPELREGLAKLIRDLRTAEGVMPNSAIDDLARAVPDKLCQEIVQDLRSGVGEPGGFLSPKPKPLDQALRPDPPKDERPSYMRPEKLRGWVKPMSDDRSKAQTEIFDEIVGALAGGPNDTSKLR
jgi:hypothetical protein